tara:strand:+ start:1846 stop:4323 length:2478 start_codon:yes stop_codon:yes gene_type:complete
MSVVNNVSDIAADLISGTFGPIGAAAASLAEQTFTDNTVEEMKANNEKYNDFLNYAPRTDAGKSANEGFLKTMGEGAEAVVDYYNENEEDIPDAIKDTVGSIVDTWNDLDESTRFALGNIATVGEVLPMGKAASLAKKGINNATDVRRINNAASEVPDESAYLPVQERLGAMGARQEMAAPSAVHKNGNPLGINVRESKDGTDFADLIVKGDKKYETRDTRSLDPYVGKNVGIVKTGKEKAALVGYATVGEPLEVDKEMFDALRSEHMVAEGSEFDIKEGGTKFLYPMSEVLSIEPNELPSKYKGIVARQIGESSDQQPIVGRKKKDYPTKEEWQEAHGTDLKQKRITEVKEAAAELQSGSMSVEDYDKVVSEFFPIKPITEMPELPTLREIDFSLKPKQVDTGIIGATKFIEDGTMVASRLDINAYERYDTWVVSLHDGNTKSGLSIGHGQTAVLKDVNFTTITKAAVNISQSKGKATIARMQGKWENQDPEEVYARAKALLDDPESGWVQVGYNPFRHSYFYDKNTTMPVASAEEVIQVGPLVLARGVKYNSKTDPIYATEGGGFYSSGGMVEEEMESMGFAEGGDVDSSEAFGDLEFRAELDEQLSWNALARLGYDPKASKVQSSKGIKEYIGRDSVAQTFSGDWKDDDIIENMRNNGYTFDEIKKANVKSGDVLMTPDIALQPIWSHEFTHRGMDIVRKKAKENPEAFAKEYGRDATRFILRNNGRTNELGTELFDDIEARKKYKLRDGVEYAVGPTYDDYRNKIKKDIKDGTPIDKIYGATKHMQQLVRAAQDILTERGEPEKYVKPETSIWDDIKSLVN